MITEEDDIMGQALQAIEKDREFMKLLALANRIKQDGRIKRKQEYFDRITGRMFSHCEEWEV